MPHINFCLQFILYAALLSIAAFVQPVVAAAHEPGHTAVEGESRIMPPNNGLDPPNNGLDDVNPDEGDPYGLERMNPYNSNDPHNPKVLRFQNAASFDSEEDLNVILSKDDTEPVVVGYFDVDTHALDKDVFDDLADQDGKAYTFAYTTNKELIEKLDIKGAALYVYKPSKYVQEKTGEKRRSRFGGTVFTKDILRKFIHDKALPIVGEKTFKAQERYDNVKHLPVITVFAEVDHKKNAKGFQYLSNRLKKVADGFKGRAVFNIGDKNTYNHVLKMYTLPPLLDKKAVGVGLFFDHTFYAMPESKPFSVENVKEFITQFFDGVLKGHQDEDIYAMPPAPSKPGANEFSKSVVQLTKDNFDLEITSSNKDALVDFYAPWCGHCKTLKPIYSDLADELARSDSSITIAAFDATAHQPPAGFEIRGYPTIYFVPAKSSGRKPVAHSGNRDRASIKAFIDKHHTKPV